MAQEFGCQEGKCQMLVRNAFFGRSRKWHLLRTCPFLSVANTGPCDIWGTTRHTLTLVYTVRSVGISAAHRMALSTVWHHKQKTVKVPIVSIIVSAACRQRSCTAKWKEVICTIKTMQSCSLAELLAFRQSLRASDLGTRSLDLNQSE